MKHNYPQAYFDDPRTWSFEAWQQREADKERAGFAAEWLPEGVGSVLDVGCGNGVYTNLPEPKRFKVGLDRSRIALQYINGPRLLADASRLPFDDESFDACMSMEILEHLEASIYPIALSELERIARKYILISVPYNEKLKYNTVICPVCRHAFHPFNHIRQYRSKDIETIFSFQFRLVKFTALAPVKREALPGLWNMIRVYQHRQGRNFPNTAICPQCGYKTDNHVVPEKHAPQAQSVIKNLRQLWPKRATFTWWMALYRKDVNR